MIKQNPFKIKPEQLIERCKQVIDNEIGLKNADDLAENFTFQFPIIGPLSKTEYLKALKSFEIKNAFPDLNYGYHHFRIDPFETNRVWATASFIGTNTGPSPLGKATNKVVEAPPQSVSFSFNEEGKLSRFTGGYVMDKTLGNSGGLGGVFGLFYGIGRPLPFPEAKPWTPSFQLRLFNYFGSLFQKPSK